MEEEPKETKVVNADLKSEYALVFNIYEKYGASAQTFKTLATTLTGSGLFFSIDKQSILITLITIGMSIVFWYLEALWKAWQFVYGKRLIKIEEAISNREEIDPYQARRDWENEWHYHRCSTIWKEFWQHYVMLPYVLVVLFGSGYLIFLYASQVNAQPPQPNIISHISIQVGSSD